MKTGCVILAGGAGKRMKSEQPKVLCEVLRKPMLGWVLDSAREFGFDKTGVVTGFKHEITERYIQSLDRDIATFLQTEQKGTGDAVKCAEALIRETDHVCVLCGDAPFIDRETLKGSFEQHIATGADVTVITAEVADPTGYGRILREGDRLRAIREQKDCSPDEAKICEVNSGAYWFSSSSLLNALPQLSTNNAAGEYYLTDCIEIMGNAGVFRSENPDIVLGANTRRALYQLNEKARLNVLYRLMDEGVSFVTLDGIIIGTDVRIGCDTTVMPNSVILGSTTIGSNCTIGASVIEDCRIGNNVILNNVQAYSAVIGDGAEVSPFVQLKAGDTVR